MAEKYVSVSELRKLLGIPSDGQCTGCQFVTLHGCKDDSLRMACEAIDDAPEADVRPVVSAEWERPKGSTPRSWIFVCSKCGDRAYFPVPKYFPKGCGYSFCPNCGADMRQEGETKE